SLIYIITHLPKKIKMLPQRRAYDKFSREYLKYTAQRYHSYDELVKNPPIADLYIAGSDQIWNTLFPNGKDAAFYLNFVESEKSVKSSYAASFATPAIEQSVKSSVSSYLEGLDFISVREHSGLGILRDCGIGGGVQVVDPVFLLSKERWLELLPIKPIAEDYILVYDFDDSPKVREVAQKLAKDGGCIIYTIQDLSYSDRVLNNIDPIGFLSYIIGAKSIISNSFHATAFSLIFHKEFWVIPRRENINTRMEDLLSSVNLSHRVIGDIDNNDFDNAIDWVSVESDLKIAVSRSKEYLQRVLSAAEIKKCE
ncbi:MAG: polysaccharide pyruvyl transferase family protein, partial [Rikenellaceae bacterium]